MFSIVRFFIGGILAFKGFILIFVATTVVDRVLQQVVARFHLSSMRRPFQDKDKSLDWLWGADSF